jgi:hypothetical protein
MTDVKQALEGGDGVVDVEMDPPKLDPWTPVGHHHSPAHIREPDGEVVTFPDGGVRAWLVVAGAGHVLFATFGFVVSASRSASA